MCDFLEPYYYMWLFFKKRICINLDYFLLLSKSKKCKSSYLLPVLLRGHLLAGHGQVEGRHVHGGQLQVGGGGAVQGGVPNLVPGHYGTVLSVPCIVARGPGKLGGERLEEVVEGPGDDDVVVDAHQGRDDHHAIADT